MIRHSEIVGEERIENVRENLKFTRSSGQNTLRNIQFNSVIRHIAIDPVKLRQLIRQSHICIGGNSRLKIYGMLHCRSGKRMKKENRIFFTGIEEAKQNGYRPCGQCMRENYKKWQLENEE